MSWAGHKGEKGTRGIPAWEDLAPDICRQRMILEGRSLGLKVMVGCMTESTVGISAIAQLLPLLDYVDMDGGLLIKNDIADGVKVYDEKVHFPERNGTGVELYEK